MTYPFLTVRHAALPQKPASADDFLGRFTPRSPQEAAEQDTNPLELNDDTDDPQPPVDLGTLIPSHRELPMSMMTAIESGIGTLCFQIDGTGELEVLTEDADGNQQMVTRDFTYHDGFLLNRDGSAEFDCGSVRNLRRAVIISHGSRGALRITGPATGYTQLIPLEETESPTILAIMLITDGRIVTRALSTETETIQGAAALCGFNKLLWRDPSTAINH